STCTFVPSVGDYSSSSIRRLDRSSDDLRQPNQRDRPPRRCHCPLRRWVEADYYSNHPLALIVDMKPDPDRCTCHCGYNRNGAEIKGLYVNTYRLALFR